jgi:hypothetical protein
VKPKGHLGSQKISNFVAKIAGKNRYPELIFKRYYLSPYLSILDLLKSVFHESDFMT